MTPVVALTIASMGVTTPCVCLSVKSHLTYGASVRPENAVTYSAGNDGQNICGVFSETAPLQRSSTPSVDGHTYSRPFFLRKAARMRIIVFTTCVWWWTEAAISSQFLCRAEGGCEFRELPLVMPPSKVCPQCNAVVPIRLKVCRNRLKFALYNADRVNSPSITSDLGRVIARCLDMRKSSSMPCVPTVTYCAEGQHFSAFHCYGGLVDKSALLPKLHERQFCKSLITQLHRP